MRTKLIYSLLLSILSILFMAIFVNLYYTDLDFSTMTASTGAFSNVPDEYLPSNHISLITVAIVIAGYFLWVYVEADKLKTKHKKKS